ncbi:uncharacterized protein LOC130736713 [Lotus japonicus]|uniref:uncharacterized protein LOC130736713 n=1 Tax=Lotus japonicus TaxID=34305 RepID=UPI002583C94B|nr:uncharacterized protein LOC130736713 [Lotus japonicus]
MIVILCYKNGRTTYEEGFPPIEVLLVTWGELINLETYFQLRKSNLRLVKEFLVNLSVEVRLPESVEFRKVYVRGKSVELSPAVINKALGRGVIESVNEELSLDVIAKELLLAKSRSGLSRSCYPLGISILKHAETCVVKLPISFPSLLTEIILQQHHQILRTDEVAMSKGVPITLDHRLFLEPHVPYIVVPSSRTSAPAHVGEYGTKVIIAELQEVSKALQETIKINTARKLKVDVLLLKLQEEEGQGGEPSVDTTATQDASTDEEGGSEESAEESEGESSSED